MISSDGKELLLVTQNRDSLKVFTRPGNTTNEVVALKPDTEYAIIELANGKKRKEEFYIGNGYLSSSSRVIVKNGSISNVTISDGKNKK